MEKEKTFEKKQKSEAPSNKYKPTGENKMLPNKKNTFKKVEKHDELDIWR